MYPVHRQKSPRSLKYQPNLPTTEIKVIEIDPTQRSITEFVAKRPVFFAIKA